MAEIRRKIGSQAGPSLAPEYNFVIVEGSDDILGECSLHAVDYRNRVGQIGICIWKEQDRRHGHASDAVGQLLAWATGCLGLQRIEAWVNDGNQASAALFVRLGFVHEGTLSRRYFALGRWHAVRVYGYLTTSPSGFAAVSE